MCAEPITVMLENSLGRVTSSSSTLSSGTEARNDSFNSVKGCRGHSILSSKSPKDASPARSHSLHIKFRDAVQGQHIADVKLVESYKQYNILPDDPKDCSCALL